MIWDDKYGFEAPHQHLAKFTEYLTSASKKKRAVGIDMDLSELEKALTGLKPRCLYAVIGDEVATTLALNLAIPILKSDKPVLIFSPEISSREVNVRLFAARLGIEQYALRNGLMSVEEWAVLTQLIVSAMNKLEMQVFIDDFCLQTVGSIKRKVMGSIGSGHDVGMVVVDGMNLIGVEGEGDRRVIEAVAIGLKELSVLANCPVLVVLKVENKNEGELDVHQVLTSIDFEDVNSQADAVMAIFKGFSCQEHDDCEGQKLMKIRITKNGFGDGGVVGASDFYIDGKAILDF